MMDLDMLDHTAVCHKEIATIYAKMNNSIAEREHWLKAADLYYRAYKRQKSNCITVDTHLLIEMESCYLQALKNCGKSGCTHLYSILLELALHLMEFENAELALEYLQKAARFLQNEIYQQKIILDNMCLCVRQVENFDEALYDTTLLFTNLSKTETFMSPIRERLLEVELKLLLLHLQQFLVDGQERPKSLLALYSAQQVSKPSVMVRDEFTQASSFVSAFKQRDILKLHSIFYKDLYSKMDSFSQKLAKELINKLSPPGPTQPELQEIIDDKELDELEKRKRMFEFYQSSIKRQTNFETL
ncbi:hypothetical protein M3Y97_00216100 [Aphelenchoides bicaudatus]|nr:hypothetical protein M3Y97_00216100 [Aphelenchoides bicaudatus]